MQTRFDRQERLHQAIRTIRRIDLDAGRVRQALLRDAPISASDHRVLEAVAQGEALSLPECAAALGLKRQFVQRIAARLLRAGLIEARPNPRHKRSYLCRATAAGRALLGDLHARETALINHYVGDLNTTEVIVARRVIERIASTFSTLAAELTADGHPQSDSGEANAEG
jgi:DNA-binding MarR family transcriptional regulator